MKILTSGIPLIPSKILNKPLQEISSRLNLGDECIAKLFGKPNKEIMELEVDKKNKRVIILDDTSSHIDTLLSEFLLNKPLVFDSFRYYKRKRNRNFLYIKLKKLGRRL